MDWAGIAGAASILGFTLFCALAAYLAWCSTGRMLPARFRYRVFPIYLAFGIGLAAAYGPAFSPQAEALSRTGFWIVAFFEFSLLMLLWFSFYSMVDHSVRGRSCVVLMQASQPLTKEDLAQTYLGESPEDRRLAKFVTAGLLVNRGGRYELTPRGRLLSAVLAVLDRVLGTGLPRS